MEKKIKEEEILIIEDDTDIAKLLTYYSGHYAGYGHKVFPGDAQRIYTPVTYP